MRTFKSVVEELITGFKNGTIGLGHKEPPPKPTQEQLDKAFGSIMNFLEGKPQPGDFKVEFEHPMAGQTLGANPEIPDGTFVYIKAEPLQRKAGIHFKWGCQGFGFGECSLYFEDGKWKSNTEHMGADFLQDMLAAFAKQVEITE